MKENVSEIWMDVPNYEGLYQVSNLGRVKSLKFNKEKILRQGNDSKGYLCVNLYKEGKMKNCKVHRLVAKAFLENPSSLPCVNHKDENKANNCAYNLEWCTYQYNSNYGTAIERRVVSTDWKRKVANTDYKAFQQRRVAKTDYKRIGKINTLKLKNRKDLSKPILQLDLEGNLVNEYPSIHEVERQTGFKNSNICTCLKGRQKTAYGFIWKYKEE